MLLTLRILFGISEGPLSTRGLESDCVWFPRKEVGRANGLQMAGINIGTVIAPIMVAPMSLAWGWRSVLYALLVPGLILAAAVTRVVSDSSSCTGNNDFTSPAVARIP